MEHLSGFSTAREDMAPLNSFEKWSKSKSVPQITSYKDKYFHSSRKYDINPMVLASDLEGGKG
jgi:hypothetical protein